MYKLLILAICLGVSSAQTDYGKIERCYGGWEVDIQSGVTKFHESSKGLLNEDAEANWNAMVTEIKESYLAARERAGEYWEIMKQECDNNNLKCWAAAVRALRIITENASDNFYTARDYVKKSDVVCHDCLKTAFKNNGPKWIEDTTKAYETFGICLIQSY